MMSRSWCDGATQTHSENKYLLHALPRLGLYPQKAGISIRMDEQ